MKPQQETENLCKKLKPVIGNKADKLWYHYLAEDDFGQRKQAQYIEILAEKYLKQKALHTKQILLEPPTEKDSNRLTPGTHFFLENLLNPADSYLTAL